MKDPESFHSFCGGQNLVCFMNPGTRWMDLNLSGYFYDLSIAVAESDSVKPINAGINFVLKAEWKIAPWLERICL